jgi:hypothetical protein
MSPIELGDYAEQLFAAEVIRRGMLVSSPIAPASPYDWVVDNGRDLLRVQVKATNDLMKGSRSPRYRIFTTKRQNNDSGRTAYSALEVDFFAAYVHGWETWFIIPFCSVKSDRVHFSAGKSIGKYAEYKNNWSALTSRENE